MCLDWLYSEERKKVWLETQPEIITLYKGAIIIGSGKFAPLVITNRAVFKKYNKISPLTKRRWIKRRLKDEGHQYVYKKDKKYKNGKWILDSYLKTRYKPYFHFLTSKRAVERFWAYQIKRERATIIKCLVKKEHITAVGMDSEGLVIVAREFEMVGAA